MDKAQLRTEMTRRRRALTADQREQAAQRVRDALLGLALPRRIFAFVSVRDELPTRTLLDACLAQGLEVGIPKLTGRGTMDCVRYTGELVPGPYGVPTCEGAMLEPELVLVPGLAFDPQGGRVGYGGGYYDRWLSAHPAAVTLGLAFDLQVVPTVPMCPTDVALDALITDAGWRRRSSRLEALLA